MLGGDFGTILLNAMSFTHLHFVWCFFHVIHCILFELYSLVMLGAL
jgi:hypothetical protein